MQQQTPVPPGMQALLDQRSRLLDVLIEQTRTHLSTDCSVIAARSCVGDAVLDHLERHPGDLVGLLSIALCRLASQPATEGPTP
jgi:hypothetical protein